MRKAWLERALLLNAVLLCPACAHMQELFNWWRPQVWSWRLTCRRACIPPEAHSCISGPRTGHSQAQERRGSLEVLSSDKAGWQCLRRPAHTQLPHLGTA